MRSACSRPMPRPEPVMIATLPSSNIETSYWGRNYLPQPATACQGSNGSSDHLEAEAPALLLLDETEVLAVPCDHRGPDPAGAQRDEHVVQEAASKLAPEAWLLSRQCRQEGARFLPDPVAGCHDPTSALEGLVERSCLPLVSRGASAGEELLGHDRAEVGVGDVPEVTRAELACKGLVPQHRDVDAGVEQPAAGHFHASPKSRALPATRSNPSRTASRKATSSSASRMASDSLRLPRIRRARASVLGSRKTFFRTSLAIWASLCVCILSQNIRNTDTPSKGCLGVTVEASPARGETP